ncbi:GNAT family N-acetyltransferase, partial [Salmonella enterica subsp. enterica serovar Paratyphi A]
SKHGLTKEMTMKYRMEGCVDGHKFVITGEGIGYPFKGKQAINLCVVEGGPLPFAEDILSAAFMYGNRVFTEYPQDIVDYFKNSCPAGYTWDRSFLFEDGAVCICNADITVSVEENCMYHESKFYGVNFPADGPVMKKMTDNWEPSCEKIIPVPKQGILKGDVSMYLLLKDGGRLRCQFDTVYKAKSVPRKMPDWHFIQHKLTREDRSDAKNQKWHLTEHAIASGSALPAAAEGRGSLLTCGDVEENPGPSGMTEYKPTVRLATRDDVPRAVRTLAAAFADYPATRHTVDPDRHIERVTELQELFLTRVGLDIGKVWVADDGAAVAVWTTPESVEAGAVFAEIGPRMAELSGSRLAAQQQMEGLLAPHRPKEPAWFLATVGVSPDHQGKGLGSAVVLPGVEAAERAGVPAFLETSAPRNLPFYERLGFTVTADVEVPEGPRTWCMTRKPGA